MIMKGFKNKKLNLVAALAGVLLLLFAAGSSAGQSPISDESGPQGCSACEQENLTAQVDTDSLAAEPVISESSTDEGRPDGGIASDTFGAPPAVVTLVSPSGPVSSGNPTYVWNKVAGLCTTLWR